jgi:hypothetical protein
MGLMNNETTERLWLFTEGLLGEKADREDLEDLKDSVDELIEEHGLTRSVPDWNQDNPTAKDYIKNKTHGITYQDPRIILNETTYTVEEGYDYEFMLPSDIEFKSDITYNVTVNGETYSCTSFQGYSNIIGIGNLSIYGEGATDTGEPFIIEYFIDSGDGIFIVSESGEYTISIEEIDEIVKKIDKKYLPSTIGAEGEGLAAEVFNNTFDNIASGDYSHAEGANTTASAYASHAEGGGTEALEHCSHAEGQDSKASGSISHAEGDGTEASGYAGHTEGIYTIARGTAAHAEGYRTIASSDYQHVQGKNNIEDTTGTYAHIIGNGDNENKRSNAHTVDWDGNGWFAGNVTVGSSKKQLITADSVEAKLNRTTAVNASDTNYSTYMARGTSLTNNEDATLNVNGAILWIYE